LYTLDFETKGIEPWPHYPPLPVGLSIKYNDGPSGYLSWGHPTGNNCTLEQVNYILEEIWESDEPLLFQNGKFDTDVAEAHFALDYPHGRVHDTMFLIFLEDPLATTLSLKPSAERLLGLPPTEQEAVRDWLMANGVIPGSAMKNWGAHICDAPGDLVGLYAAGDTDRTYALFNLLYPRIVEKGMVEAYQRELDLLPIMQRAEHQGFRLDMEALQNDAEVYRLAYRRASQEIKDILGHGENHEFNLDSGQQLAAALLASGKSITEEEWPTTPTGKLSTARDILNSAITDPCLFKLVSYRSALKTILGTFMEPWIQKGLANRGYLHPSWHQVRDAEYGARTGRLSCSDPNLQNIPNEFPEEAPEGYPPLPLMRQYILPEPGEVLVSADFHSQEIRVLGHFAEGAIMQVYNEDPKADIHAVAADLIKDNTGLEITRKETKIVAFSILYGAGVKSMAAKMGVSVSVASSIKNAYLKILTGVKEFMREVEQRAAANQPARSWGGRLLYRPDPVVEANGRVWNKDYVLLNYLIQGSSADLTKASIIAYEKHRKYGTFLATVHDEIVISVTREHLMEEVDRLCYAMDTHANLAVPMRATVKVGINWADMKEYV